ncbi:MAG: molybdopterin-dependent oxidoreductase [Caldisphaeraceae archaeon]|nr:molybdopterin-dependent oxidoreductase [Caldisphaeraceae archaeon]MEB3798167.1 molybdopterin-dependent oxidoreductase [Caldisphaeraceae archaeon]
MEEKLIPVVCPYCSVGCRLYAVSTEGYVSRIEFDYDHSGITNRGKLCPKAVSSYQFTSSYNRLKKPLKRVGEKGEGRFEEISLDEAIKYIGSKMKEIREKYGANSIGFIGSERISVEDNYILQKLARALGTNNIDFMGRYCQTPNSMARTKVFGNAHQTNPFDDIIDSKVILIWGYNPAETNPVFFGQYVEKAVLDNGAKLIVVDPRETRGHKYAHIHLKPYPGTDLAIALAMLNVIIMGDLYDKDFVEKRTTGFAKLKESVLNYTPEWAEKISGVSSHDIELAARTLATRGPATILINEGVNQHINGLQTSLAIADLIAITGNIGKKGVFSGIYAGAHCGLCAAVTGVNPAMLPNGKPVTDEMGKMELEKIWGFKVPSQPGMDLTSMIEAACEGKVKMLYLVGANMIKSAPNTTWVKECLKKTEFLIVQDIFLSDTANYADIVLPAASWFEKTSTAINANRRVQRSFKAAEPPGEAKPDWLIMIELAKELDLGTYFKYKDADEILKEVNRVIPPLQGATPERLNAHLEGCYFPCSNENHETLRLFLDKFNTEDGKAHLVAVEYVPPPEIPDNEYPYWLTNFRLVGEFHTRTMSGNSPSLKKRWGEEYAEISPKDAEKLGINDGDLVRIETRRGYILTKAKVTPHIREGVIAVPFHWNVNTLTLEKTDPQTKMPELKSVACRISKVKG